MALKSRISLSSVKSHTDIPTGRAYPFTLLGVCIVSPQESYQDSVWPFVMKQTMGHGEQQ